MSDLDEEDLEEARPKGRPGLPVDIVRLLRALLRQWRVIAAVAVLSAVTGVVLAKTIAPKTFTTRTVIVWEPTSEQARQTLSTLVDSMLIPANLNEVKRRLKLVVPIEVLALWVQVFFDTESDVVSVEVSAGAAKDASNIANTLIAVFVEHCDRLRRSRIEEALQELRANLDIARATLTTAQEVYDTFRRDNKVIDVPTETTLAIHEAASLRSRAEAARSDAQAEAARARLLEQEAHRENALVVTGRSTSRSNGPALAAARLELETARARLSSDHPRIAALESQIAALEATDDEVESVSSGQNAQLATIRSSLAQASTARAAAIELQQMHTEQAIQAQDRLAKLSAVEGQTAILLSEVTNATDHVKRLEAQVPPLEAALRNPLPEFRVIAPAEEPTDPSASKSKVYAVGIPGVTIALLVVLLIALELRGLRIRTPREAAFWLNGPALGATLWPSAPDKLKELLDEVADCAAASTGNTLIVGASAGDERAAMEIANGLRARLSATPPTSVGTFEARTLIGDGDGSRTTLSEVAVESKIAVAAAAPIESNVARIQTWESGQTSITLRRASRLADRVVVVLTSNTLAMYRLASMKGRLGRDHGVGVLLVGVDSGLADLADRVGDVDAFWFTNDYEESDLA